MPHRPHILQIICHDLGRHLGCYGIASVHTPTLDALATEGVRFARSFCTSPGCSPSRAALATGRYPHSNGVMGLAHAHFGWQLAPDERHLARLLADHGYHTVLFGLQHVTYHPETLGFHERHGDRPADAVARNIERFLARGSAIGPLYLEVNFSSRTARSTLAASAPTRRRGSRYRPGCRTIRRYGRSWRDYRGRSARWTSRWRGSCRPWSARG